jgi:hypothetical protein
VRVCAATIHATGSGTGTLGRLSVGAAMAPAGPSMGDLSARDFPDSRIHRLTAQPITGKIITDRSVGK